MNQEILTQLIQALCNTKIFMPLILIAHGTHGTKWLATIRFFLHVAYGELAENLPIAFIGFDSAANTKNHVVTIPGFQPYQIPPGLIRIFEPFGVDSLKQSCGATKATQPLARRLDQIPAKDSSSDGCCQYRNFSSSLWTANLQQMRKGWETAIKATRDAEKIATCRAAGLTILETPTVEALHFVNIAGTTAQSVDIPDSLLGKIVAHEHGVNLTNSVLMILPSASSAVNRIAMRRNAAAYLLEAAMAKVQPSSVSVGCLDNSMLRSDEPIYDHLYPIGSINGYQATTNQDEVTCRLGVLALLFLTTNFMPWADQEFANTLRNQQDKRFGALICRNIGWTRHFTSPEIRRQVMKAAAINHLRQNI